jgi:hypothetical protein
MRCGVTGFEMYTLLLGCWWCVCVCVRVCVCICLLLWTLLFFYVFLIYSHIHPSWHCLFLLALCASMGSPLAHRTSMSLSCNIAVLMVILHIFGLFENISSSYKKKLFWDNSWLWQHAVVRNRIKVSCVPFTQFPLLVKSCETTDGTESLTGSPGPMQCG